MQLGIYIGKASNSKISTLVFAHFVSIVP
ncbi:hypothetical protein BDI4_580011 [Burkholderia diffusa]|nr:hypothetical protein BDI4_580011 [Burkholderia diffusa]